MKVNLRPINLADVDNLMTWVNDQEVVGRFEDLREEKTRQDEIDYVNSIDADERNFVYTVETSDGVYLGQAGLHSVVNGSARLAIILGNKDYHGKGFGQAALNELIDTAFRDHDLNQVYMFTRQDNDKMRHIGEKLGFGYSSVMQDHFRVGDETFNAVHMRVTKERFYETKAKPSLEVLAA